MSRDFFKVVLRPNLSRIPAQRGLLLSEHVPIFVEVSRDAVLAGAGTLSDASILGRIFSAEGYTARTCRVVKILTSLLSTFEKLQKQRKTLFFIHRFTKSEDMPGMHCDFYKSGFFA